MPTAAAPVAPVEEAEWERVVNAAKLRVRSEISLEEWWKFGFDGKRAAEFETIAAQGDVPLGAVERIRHGELSRDEFWERFERPAVPCVISGIPEAEAWPAWKKWNWSDFRERFAKSSFQVGKGDDGRACHLRVDHFDRYLEHHCDDSPLYLFDSKFGKHPELLQEYKAPEYFPDDYMALPGAGDRPPYRWIGIGPRRSGTVCHQDPLCTSAWNTLICGRKRWVLLDPATTRKMAKGKDVMREGDDDEAINYFIDLLPRLREKGLKTIEFVQYPGDTVFLPGRWWHAVLNLDDTIVVTQNYCGRINFPLIWRSAREERPCWSHRWLRAMDKAMPEVGKKARIMNEEDGFDMGALLVRNRERKKKQRQRGDRRALNRARKQAGSNFDEAVWWQERRRQQEADSSSNTDSTASTTSSSSENASSSDSSSGGS